MKMRNEVDEQLTWNVADIYETPTDFQKELKTIQKAADRFVKKYKGKLADIETVLLSLKDYEDILVMDSWLDHYAFLKEAEDYTKKESRELTHQAGNVLSAVHSQLAFFEPELLELDEKHLEAIPQTDPKYASYIRQLKKKKAIQLKTAVQEAIEQLSPTLTAPESIYQQMKLADMEFDNFTVNGQEYTLDFSSYEEIYAYHPDTDVRRKAFEQFTEVLRQYQHVAAETYYTHVQMEKTLATLHGFDSVVDYLLYEQEVDRDLYDHQLDILMKEFAPVMQTYIQHLQHIHGLEKMTFADLKMELDPDFTPTVTIEQSKEMISDAVVVLGEEYREMVMKAYPERWVDFVQNKGKETGGFYSCPFGNHPFILLTWNNQLSNVFTLIHELGHAGQGILSAKKNSILGCYLSLYLSETPSTFNELLLADSLADKSEDPRMKRFALSNMISKTYFHNMVTHLLEAVYQREVYKLIDEGKSFQADALNAIKRKVLSDFWGDAVELNEGAELTWMRQSHYYGGLYSYTYSAGLTIATQAFLNIKQNKKDAVANWMEFLSLGDQYIPVEAAKVVDVDITTNKPLSDTIAFLDNVVHQIIELSEQVK